MNEEKVKAAFDTYMRENHDDDYTRMYSAEAIDNMYFYFSNGFEAACKRSTWPEIKESVTKAAKEMCEAWGMEDNHGYSVKDTFQVGFVQGSNWRAVQSPWRKTSERLPSPNLIVTDEEIYGCVHVLAHSSNWYVPTISCYSGYDGNYQWENGIVPEYWMPIPAL